MGSGLIGLRALLYRTARAQTVSIRLGSAPPEEVLAVRYDNLAEPAFDASTFRRVRFEVAFAALSGRPEKGDTITDAAGVIWSVIEREGLPDTGAWMLGVEITHG